MNGSSPVRLNPGRDRHADTGNKKRASLLTLVDQNLCDLFSQSVEGVARQTWKTRSNLPVPAMKDSPLLVDASGFAAEGRSLWPVTLSRLTRWAGKIS